MSDLTDFFSYSNQLRENVATPNEQLSLSRRLIKESTKAVCNAFSAAPAFVKQQTGAGYLVLDDVCKPYYDSIGATPPFEELPFVGGQCPGVGYVVGFGETDQGANFFIAGTGPLLEVSANFLQPGPSGTKTYLAKVTGTNPNTGLPNTETRTINSFGAKIFIYGPVRADNQPDLCGDPETVFRPGTAPINNFGDNVTVNVGGKNYDIKIGAPSGNGSTNFSLPVTIDSELELELGNNGTEIDLQPATTIAGAPISAENPPPGFDPLDVQEGDLPEPPEGYKYAGVFTEFAQIDNNVGVIVSSWPDRIFPRIVGNLRLRLRSGDLRYMGDRYDVREDAFSRILDINGVDVVGWRANFELGFVPVFTPILRRI